MLALYVSGSTAAVVGEGVGAGAELGLGVGEEVDVGVGLESGGCEGLALGDLVGFELGAWVGFEPGGCEGFEPGDLVGFELGACVGLEPGDCEGLEPGGWVGPDPAGGDAAVPAIVGVAAGLAGGSDVPPPPLQALRPARINTLKAKSKPSNGERPLPPRRHREIFIPSDRHHARSASMSCDSCQSYRQNNVEVY